MCGLWFELGVWLVFGVGGWCAAGACCGWLVGVSAWCVAGVGTSAWCVAGDW